ncbi:hypothetical protein HAZT_HAZT004983, partial [Hyalella azteca]
MAYGQTRYDLLSQNTHSHTLPLTHKPHAATMSPKKKLCKILSSHSYDALVGGRTKIVMGAVARKASGEFSKLDVVQLVLQQQYEPLVAGTHNDDRNPLLYGEGPEELRNVMLSVASARTLVADGSLGTPQQVETEHGPITIAVVGDTTKPTIFTYHDLGLNHVTNFQSFFHYPDMRPLLGSFCVVSINAPGQEEGAPSLPQGYVYPTMDELAGTVERVRAHLNVRSFIGLGVGLGANVLTRYSLTHPQNVGQCYTYLTRYSLTHPQNVGQ